MNWYSSQDNYYSEPHHKTGDEIANDSRNRQYDYYNNGYRTQTNQYQNPYQNPYQVEDGIPVQQGVGQPINQKPMARGTFDQSSYDKGAGKAAQVGGAINPIVGAVIGAGDAIGKPIKAGAEKTDPETGLIENRGRAQRTAVVGGLFSPSKAISARASYKGGWTDFSGKKYVDSLDGGVGAYNERIKAYRDQKIKDYNNNYFNNLKQVNRQAQGAQFENPYQTNNNQYFQYT